MFSTCIKQWCWVILNISVPFYLYIFWILLYHHAFLPSLLPILTTLPTIHCVCVVQGNNSSLVVILQWPFLRKFTFFSSHGCFFIVVILVLFLFFSTDTELEYTLFQTELVWLHFVFYISSFCLMALESS